ncbi:MAG TPA: DUF2075 domain-containing protein [Candidatus Latescibacteria bacterium]|nr:DUF2075 domain-containing protein [Candidatus Latescibacterota bacterium]
MYLEYWGLKERPFESTPDPRFLFYTQEHREAMLTLQYAVTENKGAAMLTGEYGCGKTLVIRTLISGLDPKMFEVGLVVNPPPSGEELLQEILYQLGSEQRPGGRMEILRHIEEILYSNAQEDKITVVVIDEAQLITDAMGLENIRLLLNYQLNDRFLLTLILVGQPELRPVVQGMPQFEQRIGLKCHLGPLKPEDTKGLILHRLAVAGCNRSIFSEEAINLIYEHTGGIPRKIVNICDFALLMGFIRKVGQIEAGLIQELIEKEI